MQAAIAALQAGAPSTAEIDWGEVVRFYDLFDADLPIVLLFGAMFYWL